MKYRVIRDTNSKDFAARVQEALDAGWQLHGSLVIHQMVIHESSGLGLPIEGRIQTTYCREMVKQ